MNYTVYFHIGYPKSASTSLQKQLFNRHSDIINLGVFPTNNIGYDSEYIDNNSAYLQDSELRRFYDNLVMGDSIDYNEWLSHNNIVNLIEKYLKGKRKIVFSNERVASVYFSYPDLLVKADRIKTILPNARIIIVIRNQIKLIESQYRDHPFDPRSFDIGKPVSINKWIEIISNDKHNYFLNSLKYYVIYKYYSKKFGSENVKVFLFENLVGNKELFSREISKFMGISYSEVYELVRGDHENKSVNNAYNNIRKIRRLLPFDEGYDDVIPQKIKNQILNMFDRISSKSVEINDKNLNTIKRIYSVSNRMLSSELDLDLGKYGYPM